MTDLLFEWLTSQELHASPPISGGLRVVAPAPMLLSTVAQVLAILPGRPPVPPSFLFAHVSDGTLRQLLFHIRWSPNVQTASSIMYSLSTSPLRPPLAHPVSLTPLLTTDFPPAFAACLRALLPPDSAVLANDRLATAYIMARDLEHRVFGTWYCQCEDPARRVYLHPSLVASFRQEGTRARTANPWLTHDWASTRDLIRAALLLLQSSPYLAELAPQTSQPAKQPQRLVATILHNLAQLDRLIAHFLDKSPRAAANIADLLTSLCTPGACVRRELEALRIALSPHTETQ